jgi:hypothetical protein
MGEENCERAFWRARTAGGLYSQDKSEQELKSVYGVERDDTIELMRVWKTIGTRAEINWNKHHDAADIEANSRISN